MTLTLAVDTTAEFGSIALADEVLVTDKAALDDAIRGVGRHQGDTLADQLSLLLDATAAANLSKT